MYCPSPSTLQYLPQESPFNHSLSFHVHFKEYFLNGAPLGSAGSSNKSGWMSDQDFVFFMKHFIQHVRLSKENEYNSPLTVGEAVSGLTSIVWKTKVKHVSQYHTNEKVQLNRFHPCAAYTVTCHLYSQTVNPKKNTYEIELYLVWHRQSTTLSGGEISVKPENHHRPFAIWGSVDGSDKFKLKAD
ncbi:hypothetical protein DAPPUDRAFT_274703 [Daphnia pulex]|uniref:Uncharacterized protein n=1 Tax=Daphnia pulex TaxID=6669 RepID=E9I4L6_DAPPU|nr:hypothetical protein DAPPUDRAFT_274703 [Daphnia pulex]|eukprot:EFX61064.1 hypothetical protein DAPPUDRAFT_274703 [Daphnia pulex]